MTFLSTDDDQNPEITSREIDHAVATTERSRNEVIGYIDALDQCGWLWKVGDERYELRIPTYVGRGLVAATEGGEARHGRETPAAQPKEQLRVSRQRCALYRWRDDKLNLLYVGITYDVNRRSVGHARKSCWWVFARRQDVEWFPNRAEAEKAERDAIRNERPIFNRQHNDTPTARQKIADYLSIEDRMDLFYAAMTAP